MNVVLPPLPYEIDALEPYLSRRTLAAHFGRHHAGYVEKSRRLIQGTPLEDAPIAELVHASAANGDRALFNAAAQTWNHTFYWASMHPAGGGEARGAIAALIEESFDSQSAFRQQFIAAAGDLFGSGWVWLTLQDSRLKIVQTANADTPLASTQIPLLVIDVWEHAYYLDYQHRRPDYINAFMTHLINWEFANRNIEQAAAPDAKSRRWRTTASTAAASIPAPRSAVRL